MDTKKLLQARKAIKKPRFLRQNPLKVRLANKWRRSRGLQSKMRLGRAGKASSVSQGYRAPVAVRGMHQSGLIMVTVANVSGLEGLDKAKHGVVIAKVGAKKQVAIIDAAAKKELTILNLNPEKKKQAVAKDLDVRKKKRADLVSKRKKATAKKEEKEKKLDDKVDSEEKKDVEKKEKDKVLTKPDQ